MAGAINAGICKTPNTPTDFNLAVKMRLIPGVRDFSTFGVSTVLDSGDGNVDVWPVKATNLIYPTAPGLITVTSTSVDDIVGGIGAQAVVIQGLIAGVEIQDVIPMNGLGGATNSIPMDVINLMFPAAAGSTKKNQGDISAIIAGAVGIQRFMSAGVAFDNCSQYVVPAGKTALVPQLTLTVDTTSGQGGKTVLITGSVEFLGVESDIFSQSVSTDQDGKFQETFDIYADPIPEGSIIRFKNVTNDNSVTVRVGYAVRLVDNTYTI